MAENKKDKSAEFARDKSAFSKGGSEKGTAFPKAPAYLQVSPDPLHSGSADKQNQSYQEYPRVPPSFKGKTDCHLFGGNLEAFQKMGRYSDRDHPECQRLACLP